MSTIKKEGMNMQAAVAPALPTAHTKEQRPIQVYVDQDLFDAIEKEIKKRKLTIKQVVTYGIQAWLCKVNPAEAKRLGLVD